MVAMACPQRADGLEPSTLSSTHVHLQQTAELRHLFKIRLTRSA